MLTYLETQLREKMPRRVGTANQIVQVGTVTREKAEWELGSGLPCAKLPALLVQSVFLSLESHHTRYLKILRLFIKIATKILKLAFLVNRTILRCAITFCGQCMCR